MNVKRLAHTQKLPAILLALSLTSAGAEAQLSDGQWRRPSQGGAARKGVEAQPAVTVAPADPLRNETVFRRRPVAVSLVPAVLMSDGSVFADFGFGFEQVLRSCSNSLVVGELTVIGSNGVVLSQPAAPSHMQPVPNHPTASQQNLSTARRTGPTSAPAQLACFNRDAAGRVFVFR